MRLDMRDQNGQRPTLERLEQVTNLFGADPERWPPEEREGLRHLVATDPGARHLVAEAQALDQVLDLAPTTPFDEKQRAAS